MIRLQLLILIIFRIEVSFACSCADASLKIENNFPVYSFSSLTKSNFFNESNYLFFQSPMIVGKVVSMHDTPDHLEVNLDVERSVTQFEIPPDKIRIMVRTAVPKGAYCYCLPDAKFYRQLKIGQSYIVVGNSGGLDSRAFANSRIIFDANAETLRAFGNLEQIHLQAPRSSPQRVARIKSMALNKPEIAFYWATHPILPVSAQDVLALQKLQEEILRLNPQLDTAGVLHLLASKKMASHRRNDQAAQTDFLFFAAEAAATQKNYAMVFDSVKRIVSHAIERPQYNSELAAADLSSVYVKLLDSEKLKAFWLSDLGKAAIDHVHTSFYKLITRGLGNEYIASTGKKSFFAVLSQPKTTVVRWISPLANREETLFEGAGNIKWKLRPLDLGAGERAEGAAIELHKMMTIRTFPFSEKNPTILKTIFLKCSDEACEQRDICNAKSLVKSKEGLANLQRRRDKNGSEWLYLALLGDHFAKNKINQPIKVKDPASRELLIMKDWFQDYLATCSQ